MILYHSDIELLLKLTGHFSWLQRMQQLPLVGKYFTDDEVTDQYFDFRQKLLNAADRCEHLRLEEADVPVVYQIVKSGLGGAGFADGIFGERSTYTIVLDKILYRLNREYPGQFEGIES